MNLEEQEREKKQAYLRNNILDQGYDTELFLNYLTETRPENGQDIDAWNYLELKFVVKQFIDQFPPGENKYQEQQEENENEQQQQQNYEDNKQENQYEETRKPETLEQKQDQIKTNYSIQKEEITPKPQEKVNQYENKGQYNSNNMTNINKSSNFNSQQTPQPVQNKSPFENLIVPPQKRNFQNTPSPQNTGNQNFAQNNQQQQQYKTAQPGQVSGFSQQQQQQQQKQTVQQNQSSKGQVTAQPAKKNDDFDFLDDFGDFKGNQNSNQNKNQVKNQLPQYQNQNQNQIQNQNKINNNINDDFFDDFGDWNSKPQQNNQVKQPTIQNQQKNDDIWGDDFGDFSSNNQVKTTTTTNNINTNNKMGVGLGIAAVGAGIQAQNKNNLNNKQGTSKYDAFDEFDFDSVNNQNQNSNQSQIQNISKLDDAKVQQMQSKDKKEEIKMNDEALQKKRSQIEQQHQQQLEQQQKKQQIQQKQNQNQNLQKDNNLGKVPGVLSSGGKSVIQPKYQKVIECRGLESTQLGRTQNIKISITDIKQVDGSFFSSSYYLYTIYTSPLKWTVKRKFSDFQWLHQMLQKQFPASVIPAVHKKYALTSAKSVQSKRTNFLEHFLNNCLKSEEIKNSVYFQQFLELDNEKLFQQDKKKAETSVKIKYLQDFQTLDKKIESKIVQCNEVYNEEMTHMLQGIDVSYEKLISLNKQLMKDYERTASTLNDISKVFSDLNQIVKVFNSSQVEHLKTPQIEDTFTQMNNIFADQASMVSRQMEQSDELLLKFFKFQQDNFNQIKTLQSTRTKFYEEYNRRKKEGGNQSNIKAALQGNKIPAFEVSKDLKILQDQAGFYDNQLVKESKRMLEEKCKSYVEQFGLYSRLQLQINRDMQVLWTDTEKNLKSQIIQDQNKLSDTRLNLKLKNQIINQNK